MLYQPTFHFINLRNVPSAVKVCSIEQLYNQQWYSFSFLLRYPWMLSLVCLLAHLWLTWTSALMRCMKIALFCCSQSKYIRTFIPSAVLCLMLTASSFRSHTHTHTQIPWCTRKRICITQNCMLRSRINKQNVYICPDAIIHSFTDADYSCVNESWDEIEWETSVFDVDIKINK